MSKNRVLMRCWSELFSAFKQNAGAVILLTLFSLFSVHLLDSSETVFGSADDISFSEFGLVDIPVSFSLAVVWSAVFAILDFVIVRFGRQMLEGKKRRPTTRISLVLFGKRTGIIIMAAVILAAWLPYFFSWCPGGVYEDTWGVINNAEKGIWSNRHTFFYEAVWWLLIMIASGFGKGLAFASALMTLVQLVMFALVLAYSVRWLNRWADIRRGICLIVFVIYCFVPVFPLFAISLWKDSFFTAFLFLYSLKYIELVFSKKASTRDIWGICLLALLVSFTRGNGVYVAMGSIIVLFILKRKDLHQWKQCFSFLGAALLTVLLIQGPLYSVMGANSPIEENLGVPLQQIGAVIANDGDLSEAQLSYFGSILPIDVWKEAYAPFIVDTVKWNADFNASVISDDPVLFVKEYVLLGLSNPGIYFESFFLNNAGFWDPFVGYKENVACYQWAMWSSVPIFQHDLIDEFAGFSLRGLLEPRVFPTGGLFAWVMIIGASMCASLTKRASAALAFAPLILAWLTLMVATPLAISMRYFFIGIFMAPICILLPVSLALGGKAKEA